MGQGSIRQMGWDKFRGVVVTKPTEEEAWFAGHDAAMYGADTKNCHFRFFASPELTKAWETGQKAGNWERETKTA